MGKIVKRKKKGRPPKSDLDRRAELTHDPRPGSRREPDLRRSTRRRSITYVDDFYDDLDYEEEEEEEGDLEEDDDEEERRREKKVKLVTKIQSHSTCKRVDSVSRVGGGGGRRSLGHLSAPESSSDYGDDNKPFKKRKIDGDDGFTEQNKRDDDDDEEEEDEDANANVDEDDDEEDDVRSVRSRDQKKNSKPNGVTQRLGTVQPQGKLSDSSKGAPLPDRQQLELILDKLQKKDTYGVYAEPVDPEELPDYHDVIEQPMDFGTVRKKLANGAYSTLEQFENDVDLICTNAMHYNAPETIYFKQARAIQDLARKKFEKLRNEFQCTVAEPKLEETIKATPILRKPIKKPSCKTIQEPIGSDFSSGATLATAGDICPLPNATQAGSHEKPSTVDGQVDGNSPLTESKPEKVEEQISGKGFPSKLGRKSFVLDENRRATYSISDQPVVRTESMCTIFEGENMQLVYVGLQADHSYARSLSRFAASLGPVAWKVASRRIEQALPVGVKFGRGWVGEYEPLPTPVLMLETRAKKRPSSVLPVKLTKDENAVARMKVRECEPLSTAPQMIENKMHWHVDKNSQVKPESKDRFAGESKFSKNDTQLGLRTVNSSGLTASCKLHDPVKEGHFTNPTSDGKLGFIGVPGSKSIINATYQQQNLSSMNNVRSEKMILKQAELHRSACGSSNGIAPQKQLEHNSEIPTSRLLEVVSRNRNLVQSAPVRQSEADGVVTARLPNVKAGSSSNNQQASSLPYAVAANQQNRAAIYFPRGNHEQGLSDPVQMMRMLAEKTQNQQKSLNFAAMEGVQSTSSDPSTRRDDSSVAATAAARAWMTLGAANFKPSDTSGSPKMQIAATSLYNSARDVPQNREETPVSRGQFLCKNTKLPPQVFLPQPTRAGDESRIQNNRQAVFPQLVTTDLSRFQMQSPWHLLPHSQPSRKQDTLPPDLNISFQASGSPRQSSGAIDSQQPDLALQL